MSDDVARMTTGAGFAAFLIEPSGVRYGKGLEDARELLGIPGAITHFETERRVGLGIGQGAVDTVTADRQIAAAVDGESAVGNGAPKTPVSAPSGHQDPLTIPASRLDFEVLCDGVRAAIHRDSEPCAKSGGHRCEGSLRKRRIRRKDSGIQGYVPAGKAPNRNDGPPPNRPCERRRDCIDELYGQVSAGDGLDHGDRRGERPSVCVRSGARVLGHWPQ